MHKIFDKLGRQLSIFLAEVQSDRYDLDQVIASAEKPMSYNFPRMISWFIVLKLSEDQSVSCQWEPLKILSSERRGANLKSFWSKVLIDICVKLTAENDLLVQTSKTY